MPPFDIPALTRGISGLFTASAEGKKDAEDRARKQQRLVMADLLSQKRVQEFVDAGRHTRAMAAKKEEARLTKAAEIREGQQRRNAFIRGLLSPEDLEGLTELEDLNLEGQNKALEGVLKRKRATVVADAASERISSRQGPARDPEEVKAEDREKAIISERGRILRDAPGLSESEAIAEATKRIDEQRFLLESHALMQRLEEGGGKAIHLGGEQVEVPNPTQGPATPGDDLSLVRQSLGGNREENIANLREAGYTEEEIALILGG